MSSKLDHEYKTAKSRKSELNMIIEEYEDKLKRIQNKKIRRQLKEAKNKQKEALRKQQEEIDK